MHAYTTDYVRTDTDTEFNDALLQFTVYSIQIVTGAQGISEHLFSRSWEMLHKVKDRG